MCRAFVFPGQGSQAVGMGSALAENYPEARAVFDEVDEALGQSLSRLMFEGPEDQLTLTENAQPALMAVSIAAVRVLAARGARLAEKCDYVAGHSLGEYSALAAAEAFTLADTARLLRTRGQAMQKAVPVGIGAMAALIGLDLEEAHAVAKEAAQGEVCEAANDNTPGQVVVSGHRSAVERAVEIARGHGAKRSVLLQVSAPFHCRLMRPAAKVMEEALGEVDISPPVVPLVANVTAEEVREPDRIRQLLVNQVTGAVRWRESVLFLRRKGVDKLLELGSGKALSGMARRIDKALTATRVHVPEEVDAALAEMA